MDSFNLKTIYYFNRFRKKNEIILKCIKLYIIMEGLYKFLEKQPLIIISTLGNVANGKTSLLKKLTGLNLMKFKKEVKNNMTIKLGYTNSKIMKCPNCPKPYCYQINNTNCEHCETQMELYLFISFVDAPGHSDLQSTALSGANNMDYCLLLISTDNELEINKKADSVNNYINEHYKVIKLLDLEKKTVIIQNKIDLVGMEVAKNQYNLIKRKYKVDGVIPISAQFGYNVNYILQYLVEKIPRPFCINKETGEVKYDEKLIERIEKPLKMSIIRSFDVNKPGTEIENLQGAVAGGTIKEGKIKIGDKIKILPGIIHKDKLIQLKAEVISLKTESDNLEEGYPGGLIGVGLSLDPSLSKEDRLVGNIIVKEENTSVKCFNRATINYEEYEEDDINKIKEDEMYNLMLYTMKRLVKIELIEKIDKKLVFQSTTSLAGEKGDNVVITLNNKILLFGKIIELE